jgi:hypothetical protein
MRLFLLNRLGISSNVHLVHIVENSSFCTTPKSFVSTGLQSRSCLSYVSYATTAVTSPRYIARHGPHRKCIFHYCVFSRWRETTCPQRCSLATAGIPSPVYTAVAWQWVYMSQYTSIRCNALYMTSVRFSTWTPVVLTVLMVFRSNARQMQAKYHDWGTTETFQVLPNASFINHYIFTCKGFERDL